MSDRMFRCGDHEALVSYLYQEGDPLERALVRAHLAECTRCADEVQALGETRQHVLAWAPPEVPLGVRVPAMAAAVAAPAPRGRWWSQPMPAWAQVAAAGLIFAAGMSVGSSRAPGEALVTPAPPVMAEAGQPQVTATELAAVEERLQAVLDARVRAAVGDEVAALRTAPANVPAAPMPDLDALLRAVDARIARSDERWRLEFAKDVQALQRGLRALELEHGIAMDDLKIQRAALEWFVAQAEAMGYAQAAFAARR